MKTNSKNWVVYFKKEGRNKQRMEITWKQKQHGNKNMETKNVTKERKPLNVNNQGKSTSYSTLQFLCNICKSGTSPNLKYSMMFQQNVAKRDKKSIYSFITCVYIYAFIHILFFNTECNLMVFSTKKVKFRCTLAVNRNF